MKATLPGPHVPLVGPDGLINPVWYRYFADHERLGLAGLADVENGAPANGEVPIFNATSKKFEFGAN